MKNSDYEYIYPGTSISIHDVQKVELEMLIEFDRICRKYSIPYSLIGGTLLGSIRHGGFIPWDDDIDVAMLRSDYDKFIKVAFTEMDSSLFLQTCFTDPQAVLQFAKIRKNNTIYEYSMDVGSKYHKGIWIDIFPYDNVKTNRKSIFVMSTQIKFLYALTTSSVKKRIEETSSYTKKAVRYFMRAILILLRKPTVDKMLLSVFTKYSNLNTEYVTSLTNGITKKRFNFPEKTGYPYTNLVKRSEFEKIIDVNFCGHSFMAFKNYDRFLRDNYGDYMVLPSEDKRFPEHDIVSISLSEK